MKKINELTRSRQSVGLYVSDFLSPSMTFIYRQIISLSNKYKIIPLTRMRRNEELFPYAPIHEYPLNYSERIINKINRIRGRSYAKLSKDADIFFENKIKEEKIELIHAHFGTSAVEIMDLVNRLNVPLVTTLHGFDASYMLKNRGYVKQLNKLFECSEIITVSEKMKCDIIKMGCNPNKIEAIHLGIPVSKFKYIQKKSINEKVRDGEVVNFLQISNFVEKKGHIYTIRAFWRLLEKKSNIKLTLVGSGPEKRRCQELVNQLNIEEYVDFVEHVNEVEVARMMSEADCFLHHSITSRSGDTEGIPTVMMEAMSSGLPVVSTIHAGIPELIIDNKTGYLTEEKDVDQYVNKLIKILSDDGSLGKNGRKIVENLFNSQVQDDKLAKFYEKCI